MIMIVVTHISGKSYDEEGGILALPRGSGARLQSLRQEVRSWLCIARTRTLPSSSGEDRMIIRFDKAKDEESMGKIDDIAVKFDPHTMNMSSTCAAAMKSAKHGGADDPQHLR